MVPSKSDDEILHLFVGAKNIDRNSTSRLDIYQGNYSAFFAKYECVKKTNEKIKDY